MRGWTSTLLCVRQDQWSFRKTGVMETLASPADIGVYRVAQKVSHYHDSSLNPIETQWSPGAKPR